MIISKFLVDFFHKCIDANQEHQVMFCTDNKQNILYKFTFQELKFCDDFFVKMEKFEFNKEKFEIELPFDSKEYAVYLSAELCNYITSNFIEEISEEEYELKYKEWKFSTSRK